MAVFGAQLLYYAILMGCFVGGSGLAWLIVGRWVDAQSSTALGITVLITAMIICCIAVFSLFHPAAEKVRELACSDALYFDDCMGYS